MLGLDPTAFALTNNEIIKFLEMLIHAHHHHHHYLHHHHVNEPWLCPTHLRAPPLHHHHLHQIQDPSERSSLDVSTSASDRPVEAVPLQEDYK